MWGARHLQRVQGHSSGDDPRGREGAGPAIVTVNAVAPDVVTRGWLDAVTDEVRAEQLRSIPLRRREFAEVAAFLAGNRASNATGQVIGVDAAMVV